MRAPRVVEIVREYPYGITSAQFSRIGRVSPREATQSLHRCHKKGFLNARRLGPLGRGRPSNLYSVSKKGESFLAWYHEALIPHVSDPEGLLDPEDLVTIQMYVSYLFASDDPGNREIIGMIQRELSRIVKVPVRIMYKPRTRAGKLITDQAGNVLVDIAVRSSRRRRINPQDLLGMATGDKDLLSKLELATIINKVDDWKYEGLRTKEIVSRLDALFEQLQMPFETRYTVLRMLFAHGLIGSHVEEDPFDFDSS